MQSSPNRQRPRWGRISRNAAASSTSGTSQRPNSRIPSGDTSGDNSGDCTTIDATSVDDSGDGDTVDDSSILDPGFDTGDDSGDGS